MADHPLRPATDHSLGRPLPHQQANRTQAPPQATCAFDPRVSCGISTSFPALSPTRGQIPTRYSPVRHCRSCPRPCDLHVLSMPPAFALSQDQTLRFISGPMHFPGCLHIQGGCPEAINEQDPTHLPCCYGVATRTSRNVCHLRSKNTSTNALRSIRQPDPKSPDPPRCPDRHARGMTAGRRQRIPSKSRFNFQRAKPIALVTCLSAAPIALAESSLSAEAESFSGTARPMQALVQRGEAAM